MRVCSETVDAFAYALTAHLCRQLVAVPEERFHELVAAEVSFLATVPVQPVSMQQAHSRCKRKQAADGPAGML